MSDESPKRLRLSLAEFMALSAEPTKDTGPQTTPKAASTSFSAQDMHQQMIPLLIVELSKYVSAHQLRILPLDVELDEGQRVQPDIFWVSAQNDRCVLAPTGWRGAPDLIVEVLSAQTASQDRGRKYELYERAGVREYWLVDPEASYIEVYVNQEGRFVRQGVFDSSRIFISPVLGDKIIDMRPVFQWAGS